MSSLFHGNRLTIAEPNMNRNSPSVEIPAPVDEVSEIEAVIAEYLERKRRGEAITVQGFAAEYPHLIDRLLSILPTIDFLESGEDEEPGFGLDNFPAGLLTTYEPLRVIGAGGMGVVYEANHELRNDVAVKVMQVGLADSSEKRFNREAQIAASLHHPHIVPVFDFGRSDDRLFLSMKRIVGADLSEILGQRSRTHEDSGVVDRSKGFAEKCANKLESNWQMIARIGYEVASALEYAHSNGILHRDIKPANLILDHDEKVWVTDFGLAKLTHSETELTKSNNAVGTLRYMAPEQIENLCDERTDIYSLGITLYEMTRSLDGRLSFFYSRHPLAKPSEENPSIPRGLEDAILKACNPEPEDRFQTATELKKELAKFCDRRSRNRDKKNLFMAGQLVCLILLSAFLSNRILSKPPVQVKTVLQSPILPEGLSNASQRYFPESGVSLLETRIAHSVDDAEEWFKGQVFLGSDDLELIWDEAQQTIGLKFRYCHIPKNAEILDATIQFHCLEADIGETNLRIYTEKGVNDENFGAEYGISSRSKFDRFVEWKSIPEWKECDSGAAQKTPSLKELVQLAVQQEQWSTKSPLVFIIEGEGKRVAYSYDSSPDKAPLLTVRFRVKDACDLAANLNE